MPTPLDVRQAAWLTWCIKILPYAIGVWLVTSLTLAIPHGEGHSLSSDLASVVMLREIAFAFAAAAIVGIAVAVMLHVLGRD